MSVFFRGPEILAMAEQIERNGGRFYRHAAESIEDAAARELLLGLAEMEDEHLVIFARMKDAVARKTEGTARNDAYGVERKYLQAWADGHVFEVKTDPVEELSGQETIEDILKIAIGMEKESIVFYLGFKDAVPTKSDRDQIDKILKEEMEHIAALSTRLKALRNELV